MQERQRQEDRTRFVVRRSALSWFSRGTRPRFSAHPIRAGSLETCGFKQRFWSLLGLRPKVTRARGHGASPFRCWKKWNRRRQKLKKVTRRRHPRPQARPHRKLHEKDAFWRPFQLFMYISSHARCASSRRNLTRIGTPNSPHVPIFSSKSVSASSVAANSTWYIF